LTCFFSIFSSGGGPPEPPEIWGEAPPLTPPAMTGAKSPASPLMDSDLKELSKWCNLNKMVVNVNKTKYINFNSVNFEFSEPVRFQIVLMEITAIVK